MPSVTVLWRMFYILTLLKLYKIYFVIWNLKIENTIIDDPICIMCCSHINTISSTLISQNKKPFSVIRCSFFLSLFLSLSLSTLYSLLFDLKFVSSLSMSCCCDCDTTAPYSIYKWNVNRLFKLNYTTHCKKIVNCLIKIIYVHINMLMWWM